MTVTLHKVTILTVLICSCATAKPVPPANPAGHTKRIPAFTVVRPTGSSSIRLEPERDYEVREMRFERPPGAPPKDLRILVFNPKDEQSSVMFAIGADGYRKTEKAIARLYEGATVTKVPGTIAGRRVEWWHYRDSHHLYSTSYTSLPDKRGVEHPVYVDLVANTPERLSSLEQAFSGLEFY